MKMNVRTCRSTIFVVLTTTSLCMIGTAASAQKLMQAAQAKKISN